MVIELQYKIYYGILPSESIVDLCGAANNAANHKNPDKLRQAKQKHIDICNERNQFYIKLEESILKNGILNPVVINAGYVTPHLQFLFKGQTDFLVCDNNGGSRLRIAQKHKLTMPCIILDFIEKFANDSNHKELFTAKEIIKCYTNPPTNIRMYEDKISIENPYHTHLK